MEIFVTRKGSVVSICRGRAEEHSFPFHHLALSSSFKNNSKNVNTKTPPKPRIGIDKTLEMW